MQVGDLVRRTYGEGRRPVAILVGWRWEGAVALVRWLGSDEVEEIGSQYVEDMSEKHD